MALATFLVQGLTLAPLIRWLGLVGDSGATQETRLARGAAARAGLHLLDSYRTPSADLEPFVQHLRSYYEGQRAAALSAGAAPWPATTYADTMAQQAIELRQRVLDAERSALITLRDQDIIGDGVLQQLRHEIDLEAER